MINGVVNYRDFDYNYISKAAAQKRRRGNQGRRNNERRYKDIFAAFDIETTNDLKAGQAYMYIWQFQIDDITIIGRTWDEFLTFIHNIAARLDPDVYLMVYVHNLSFEFQFLRGIYDFKCEEVFATEPRKVLKCEMLKHFEFRCSYYLTNMSLSEFTRKMGVQDLKLSGEEFNYKKQRYPWTELTDRELLYCINDVRGLVQALRIQFDMDHDNFYTIPLTSTGYVRRDCKAAMRHFNRQDLRDMLPDYEVFAMLREAFRGGNTHANRYYSEQILEDVRSEDIVSAYPAEQLTNLFPMSPWLKEENISLDRVVRKIDKHNRACIMRVAIWNISLNNPLWGCPYIPKAKCRNLINGWYDNGRVLSADYLEITITDIDLKIILDEYKFDCIKFIDFYHSRYGKLPKALRDVIFYYFNEKTKLKGVAGQEVYYMKQKNKLNSVFGQSVQNPVSASIDFINDDFVYRNENEIELLEKANLRAKFNYAWGVWTTCRCRAKLETALKIAGNDFVYCDTDSVKYIGDHKNEFDRLNSQLKRRAIDAGAYATDPKGKTHYLGMFEEDGVYKRFITKGAKKYAYENEDGSIGITVAGVAKKKGAEELVAAGGLEAFVDGFTFRAAGGTESVYNDKPEIKKIIREGREIPITSNVLIKDSTYTLGVAAEYRRLLDDIKFWSNPENFI